jgi:hypothetical protein
MLCSPKEVVSMRAQISDALGEGGETMMDARAGRWGSTANPVYGIRVGFGNRDRHFPRPDTTGSDVLIEVEVDGRPHTFALTPGFWNNRLSWPKGEPPQVRLIRVSGSRFRLLPG